MRDPYEVLGVDRKASAGDIKSAYRRLAKKLHPDANKNDPKAATRFAELNAALTAQPKWRQADENLLALASAYRLQNKLPPAVAALMAD